MSCRILEGLEQRREELELATVVFAECVLAYIIIVVVGGAESVEEKVNRSAKLESFFKLVSGRTSKRRTFLPLLIM